MLPFPLVCTQTDTPTHYPSLGVTCIHFFMQLTAWSLTNSSGILLLLPITKCFCLCYYYYLITRFSDPSRPAKLDNTVKVLVGCDNTKYVI